MQCEFDSMVETVCEGQIVLGYLVQYVEVQYAYCTHANLCVRSPCLMT